MKNLLELTIDVTDAIPTLDDLLKYEIASMRVRTRGPGGGNPAITLGFHGHNHARSFLREWYGSDDVDGDLAVATA